MQLNLYPIGFLGMAVILLVIAELMIRGLVKRLESPQESFSNRLKGFSFRFYHKSGFLWEISFFMCYIFSGFFLILGFPIPSDYNSIPAWILFFVYFIRSDRLRNCVDRMYSRAKWTMKWEDFELYKNLMENQNQTFLEIINDPQKLTKLEIAAKHARNAVMFDPKEMRRVESREEIEVRLTNHLEFLMSNESSVTYTIEEMYVILFILSGKANFPEGLVKDFLSKQDNLHLLHE